jgi:hypothetical protein
VNIPAEVLDQRVYAQMFAAVHSFQDGNESLQTLIENLKTFSSQLQSVDEPWRNEFDGLVSELEYAYDTSVESGLSSAAFGQVTNVVRDLELMVFAARTWTEQEKETLRKIIEVHGPKYSAILIMGCARVSLQIKLKIFATLFALNVRRTASLTVR